MLIGPNLIPNEDYRQTVSSQSSFLRLRSQLVENLNREFASIPETLGYPLNARSVESLSPSAFLSSRVNRVQAAFASQYDSNVNPLSSSYYRPTERNPSLGPHFYFYIGERIQEVVRNAPSVYERNLMPKIQAEIKKEYPGAVILEEKNIGPWRFFLVANGGFLTVFGPGTSDWGSKQGYHNITDLTRINVYDPNISDLAVRSEYRRLTGVTDNELTKAQMIDFLKGRFDTAQRLNRTVETWERKYDKIDAAFGFSKGAYNTSKIDRPGIVHIMHCSPDNIAGQHNFRQGNDGVSYFTLGSDICITMGNEGHVVAGFYKHFNKDDTFEDLYAGRFGKFATRKQASPSPSESKTSRIPPIGITHDNSYLESPFLKANLSSSSPHWKSKVDVKTGRELKYKSDELTPEQVRALDPELKDLLDTATKGDIPNEETVVLPDEVVAADAIRRQQERLESSKKEIPGFREGMEITGIRLGMTVAGATGLIITLKSGAEAFIVAANGTYLAGVQVSMTSGFATAVGTGLLYAAPVVAAIVVVNLYQQHKAKKVVHHLKKHVKQTQNEMAENQGKVNKFEDFVQNFQEQGLAKTEFLGEVNKIVNEIEASANSMRRRRQYAEKHNDKSGDAGNQYGIQNLQLRQMAMDMKALANQVVAGKEGELLAKDLQGQAIPILAQKLESLVSKRVLSLSEGIQQHVIFEEIARQAESGNQEALVYLQGIENKPMAVIAAPSDVAVPLPIAVDKFSGGVIEHGIKYIVFEKWSHDVDQYYREFQQALKTGDKKAVEAAGAKVLHQLEHTAGGEKKKAWNFHTTKLKHIPNCKTAYDYYKPYIEQVRANVTDTLAKFQAAQSNVPTMHTPAFITSDQAQGIAAGLMCLKFNEGIQKLDNSEISVSEKNGCFRELVGLANQMQSSGINDPRIDSILDIESNFDSYERYLEHAERSKVIDSIVNNYLRIRNELAQDGLPEAEYERLLNESIDEAQKLINLNFSEDDISFEQDNPEMKRQFVGEVKGHREAVQQYRESRVRDAAILEDFNALTECANKFNQNNLSVKEAKALWLQITQLIDELQKNKKVQIEDLKLILGTSENAEQAYEWIGNLGKEANLYLKKDLYENTVYSYAISPAFRIASGIANDIHRFQGCTKRKIFAHGFSAMNSLFSDYVPRLTLYVAAYAKGESEDVLKVLADNTQKAWNESTIQKVADFVRNPRVINGDHFQGLNTVLQLCGRVIPSATSELLKSKWVPGRVKQVLESDRMKVVANVANQVLKTIDLAASCVHVFGTASLIKEARKDNKWNDVKARIATECIEALSSAVEYAETLRRYDVKAGELNFVTEKIRAFMINFRGSLPENSVYYMGKDALKVAAYGVSSLMLESPSLGGTALANAVVSLKQGYSGKYLDDVLSGIMNNLDFYASRSKAPEYLALFNQSLDNLKYQLGSKLDPSYNSANDSNVVRHAISTFRKYQYA